MSLSLREAIALAQTWERGTEGTVRIGDSSSAATHPWAPTYLCSHRERPPLHPPREPATRPQPVSALGSQSRIPGKAASSPTDMDEVLHDFTTYKLVISSWSQHTKHEVNEYEQEDAAIWKKAKY